MTSYAVVVPTVGRPSLQVLLRGLAAAAEHVPEAAPSAVVVSDGSTGGPAAARNAGWRRADRLGVEWVAFLDDDVELARTWCRDLVADLAACDDGVAATSARVVVPLPADRRPTDWERGTAGLATARWITADMAYRTAALRAVGGFDERFPRAYREDADLALRVQDAGWTIAQGARTTTHPVRPAGPWASVRQQRGNADDVLMRRRHGRGWRERAAAPRGLRRTHVATTTALAAGAALLAAGRPRPGAALVAGWAALTARLAWRRIEPGPRGRSEVLRMLATSLAIPPAATAWWLHGLVRHRAVRPAAAPSSTAGAAVEAVLFDRDGTLVHDVPYNGDPSRVRPVDGAADAVAALRSRGVRVGVVSNQSGIARGLLTDEQVRAVNARVDALVGPFDTWQVCPHAPDDGCPCRKPAPAMVRRAIDALRTTPERTVVVGDIGVDVEAARAAGARAVLVPTAVTRPEEVAHAGRVATVARSLPDAVARILQGRV